MNSKLLREKRASDYAIMEDLQKRAAGEGRLMNAEELAQWDAADANFKNYTDQISRLERWNEINTEERGVNAVEQTINAMPRDAREIVKSPEYHTAFMKALAKRDEASMFEVSFRLLPEDASGSYGKIVDRTWTPAS